MEISDTTIIGCVVSLTGAICYMANLIYNDKKNQIAGMKKTIIQHGKDAAVMKATADTMQEEINRLTQGCGAPSCRWSHNKILPNIDNKT